MSDQGQDNYQNMNTEERTEGRRRYPVNKTGAKDEWQALVQHQNETNQMISRFEKELRGLRSKELANAHDVKIQERIADKEREIFQKKMEADEVQRRMDGFKMDVMRQKQAHQAIRENLANAYDEHIEQRSTIQAESKLKAIEDERRSLEEAKKLLDFQRQRNIERYKLEQEYFTEDMIKAHEKHYHEKLKEIEDKQRFNEMMQQNEMKQLLKEQNYKNFFKITAENQKVLQDLHAQQVLSPQIKKEHQIEDIITKNVDIENQRKAKLEYDRIKNRVDKSLEMSMVNRDKISKNQDIKEQEKIEKQTRAQDSLKQLLDYHAYQQAMKDQKREFQKNYKTFLDMQSQDHDVRVRNNRMTKDEKKLNFHDLQAYKVQDPKMHALLPGFMNSKFTPLHKPEENKISSNDGNIFATQSYDKRLGTYDGIAGIGPDQGLGTLKNLSKEISRTSQQLQYSRNPSLPQHNYNPSYDAGTNQASQIYGLQQTQPQNQSNIADNLSAPNLQPRKYISEQPYADGPLNSGKPRGIDNTSRHLSVDESRNNPYNNNPPSSSPNFKIGSKYQNITGLGESLAPTGLKIHNPITNPMPNSIQNPYILRELNKYSSRRPNNLVSVGNNVING